MLEDIERGDEEDRSGHGTLTPHQSHPPCKIHAGFGAQVHLFSCPRRHVHQSSKLRSSRLSCNTSRTVPSPGLPPAIRDEGFHFPKEEGHQGSQRREEGEGSRVTVFKCNLQVQTFSFLTRFDTGDTIKEHEALRIYSSGTLAGRRGVECRLPPTLHGLDGGPASKRPRNEGPDVQ